MPNILEEKIDETMECLEIDSPPGGGGWISSSSRKEAVCNIQILVKNECIEFLEWSANRNLECSLGVFVDNYGTYSSMDEYYELYIKSKTS